MKDLLPDWEWEPVVRALMGCKGFKEVAAMTIISELGDLRRFSNPRKLMAFLGLVPGEYSSGSKRRRGGQPREVKELSWRMQHRLHKRYVKLKAREKRENKAIIAVARELSAFIWELQNKLDLPIPTK